MNPKADSMKNLFIKFETFGEILDSTKRKKLSDEIYNHLQLEPQKGIKFKNWETDNFGSAITTILKNASMREICSQEPEIAEKVTLEILDFVNRTKKKILATTSPFGEEIKLLEKYKSAPIENLLSEWKVIDSFIKQTYLKSDLDLDFYKAEYQQILDKAKASSGKDLNFHGLKEHFIEAWEALIFRKQTSWELQLIEEQRKIFCQELYRRIEELKKLKELLEPFTNELGRLWDMSQGRWQSTDFDVLSRYSELLKKDKSLIELSEMLGRMQQAEREFEEEIFSSSVLSPEWKIQHAIKSDLVGIRESDDLSSLLPSEMVLLADETMHSIFVKKLVEKKLQTFDYQAKLMSFKEEGVLEKRKKEKEDSKGPYIICVDKSGSMHGTPETLAKTLCFSLLKMAIRDNRKCYLISFSTHIETLDMTDLRNSLDKVIHFLSMSFHGGTDAGPALNEALRMLNTTHYKKADVLMISDWIMPGFDEVTKGLINKAKNKKTKFHSLMISSSQNPAIIQDFDNNWVYDATKPTSVLTLVKNLRSI
jgi:uncharacterized protein with von Willebrand factor type A (vWA) domain